MRMPVADPVLTARLYQETRERISELVTGLDEDAALSTAVAACPGWSVRDVVAHVAAVADDWADGCLSGPPTDEETAAQIARFGGHDMADILAAWTDAAARLDRMAETAGVAPPLGDITSHEHDVRGAIGRPGARDSTAVWWTLRPVAHEPANADATACHGGRRPVSQRTRRRSRNTPPHYAIRGLALANWPPQPRPARRYGLVGRPDSGTRSSYMFGPADVDVVE